MACGLVEVPWRNFLKICVNFFDHFLRTSIHQSDEWVLLRNGQIFRQMFSWKWILLPMHSYDSKYSLYEQKYLCDTVCPTGANFTIWLLLFSRLLLTLCALMMPNDVIDFGQHWFRQWLDARQHQAITWVNADMRFIRLQRNNLQWNSNKKNTTVSVQENMFENVSCKMVAIFFRPLCVNRDAFHKHV